VEGRQSDVVGHRVEGRPPEGRTRIGGRGGADAEGRNAPSMKPKKTRKLIAKGQGMPLTNTIESVSSSVVQSMTAETEG
jgi:hypothetical protein